MKIFRIEHRSILERKGRFCVGPWSPEGWRNFPDQEMAFEVTMGLSELIASWGELKWQGLRAKEFSGGSKFNQKYLAGVERMEDLEALKDWNYFLKVAGYVLRIYSCPEDYVVRAVDFNDWTLGMISWEERKLMGQVSQLAFHWFHARRVETLELS